MQFLKDFRTSVEPYFAFKSVLRRKLLLTIDTHSDGLKK
jgi:hypothetical protein